MDLDREIEEMRTSKEAHENLLRQHRKRVHDRISEASQQALDQVRSWSEPYGFNVRLYSNGTGHPGEHNVLTLSSSRGSADFSFQMRESVLIFKTYNTYMRRSEDPEIVGLEQLEPKISQVILSYGLTKDEAFKQRAQQMANEKKDGKRRFALRVMDLAPLWIILIVGTTILVKCS